MGRSPPPISPGYRTLRVAGGVTFRLIDAGKSVLKAVGVNVEGGYNVVVVLRLSPASFSISHVIPS